MSKLDGERGVSIVSDHPFEPRDEWWSQCVSCGLAESAHASTLVDPSDRAYGDTPALIARACRECGVDLTDQEASMCSLCWRRLSESEQ